MLLINLNKIYYYYVPENILAKLVNHFSCKNVLDPTQISFLALLNHSLFPLSSQLLAN